MVMPMKGGPMMGGGKKMPPMPMEDDLFGPAEGEGEVDDASIDSMFAEEAMGAPEDKLMESLSAAGYNPTPDQMTQIMQILEGGGVAPKGLNPTDAGMEADMSAMM